MRSKLLLLWLGVAACGAMEVTPDAGEPVVDAGEVDAGEVDAGVPDAGVADAGVPDAGVMCADTWANFGQAFFAQRCSGCHALSHASVRAQQSEIYSRIESRDMPRGFTLPTATRTRVLEWLDCGAN